MSEQDIITVALLAIVAVVVIVLVLLQRRKSRRLTTRFGSEYARVVEESGGRRKGEAGLVAREKRVDAIAIVPLSATDRDRSAEAWNKAQTEFLEDPKYAVTQADHLLGEVMSKRGYPVGDFEQRAADLSVDHPLVVQNYRAVHDIAERHQHGQATTEDLRQAMILYRALFEDLIGPVAPAKANLATTSG